MPTAEVTGHFEPWRADRLQSAMTSYRRILSSHSHGQQIGIGLKRASPGGVEAWNKVRRCPHPERLPVGKSALEDSHVGPSGASRPGF